MISSKPRASSVNCLAAGSPTPPRSGPAANPRRTVTQLFGRTDLTPDTPGQGLSGPAHACEFPLSGVPVAILDGRLRLRWKPQMIPAQRLLQLLARELGELPHQPLQRAVWIGDGPLADLGSHFIHRLMTSRQTEVSASRCFDEQQVPESSTVSVAGRRVARIETSENVLCRSYERRGPPGVHTHSATARPTCALAGATDLPPRC